MLDMKKAGVYQTTLRDIKKMFAGEHVIIKADIFGTKYISKKTKKEMSPHRALKILAGDY